jgi:hypothetical protein
MKPSAFLLLLLATSVCGRDLAFTPGAAVVRFDEVGLYEIGYAYRGQAERQFAPGWGGTMDEATGVILEPVSGPEGRAAVLMHCPWRGGTGIAFQQFTVRLPRAPKIRLRGALAMSHDAIGKSDGATFRVLVAGAKLLEVHRTDAAWQDFEFDLTRLAGQTVTIRFETDPGPRNDSAFDFSLWADRALVIDGWQPATAQRPAPPPLELGRLLSVTNGSWVPLSGFAGRVSSRLEGDTAVFRYDGADGMVEYRWQSGDRLALRAQMRGDQPVEVPLSGVATLEWAQPATPLTNRWEQQGDAIVQTQTFQLSNAVAAVRMTGRLVGKSLVVEVACDQPALGRLAPGRWLPVMRRMLPMPYDSERVDYLPTENLFASAFLDWTVGQGADALYRPLTDGRRNRLRERVVFTAAWHVDEVLPNIPNPPSPWRAELGDQLLLDVWGGAFTNLAAQFETLAGYGIRRCVVLLHDWQRDGYDNGLPAHFPANAAYGGDEGMKKLVATGTRLGWRIALHENYVDYYPNYEHFDARDVALEPDGKRELAWYNPGTKIQSFAVKPDAILRLAATQSPEIHRRYRTNANYLDVHSCVPPWFHVDYDAHAAGAGSQAAVWDAHRALWAYERRVHEGPVFGEGNRHWPWSGCLDGVEAQFGSGWAEQGGRTAPLLVDFDLLKIHPLQLNHGMGYYERWWTSGNTLPPLLALDQYRMQEVAYGHQPFLGAPAWARVPLAWLEYHLTTPVSARYATAAPARIEYEVDGRWRDATAAAKAAQWQRVRVGYANGLTVTANSAPQPLRAGATELPQYGWLAEGAGVTAYTALRDGVVVDYAETRDSVFANARPAADWAFDAPQRVRAEVDGFAQTEPRTLRFSYRWLVNDTLAKDYLCFVHFRPALAETEAEDILFQQDHALAVPTSRWQSGATVNDGPHTLRLPPEVKDGDYQWLIGLWQPGEERPALAGAADRHGRMRLGVLRMRDGGKTVQFEPERDTGEARLQQYRAHLNEANRVIDFGTVRTDGSVSIHRDGAGWVLQTWPRDKKFVVELNGERFGVGRGWWRLPLTGAQEYRWQP